MMGTIVALNLGQLRGCEHQRGGNTFRQSKDRSVSGEEAKNNARGLAGRVGDRESKNSATA